MTENISINFQNLADSWPSPVISRSEVGKFSGGLVHPRTLANLDSLGQGPEGRFKVGRKTGYSVESLVNWLKDRVTTP